MNDYIDGIVDGAKLADEMFEGIPDCLRVRMACDVLFSAINPDEREKIEDLLFHYLDEAMLTEKDFDYDAVLG